jgi:hypothetical protein
MSRSPSDSSGQTLECTWHVVVPPLVVLGEVRKVVGVGTYNETNQFNNTNYTFDIMVTAFTGLVFKMTSRLKNGLRGGGKNERIENPSRSDKTNGQLTIGPNQTRGMSHFENPIPVALDLNLPFIPDLFLETEVLQNSNLNSDVVRLIGQVDSLW